jgi:hypothetical protein
MLPLRVFERIVAIERTELFPVTRSVVFTLPWRELNLAVGGGTPFAKRKNFFFSALPSRNICTIFCVGSGETRGSSDQEPACFFSDGLMYGRSLYIPRIASCLVHITRPLTGWSNGASACRSLDGETDLVGSAGEYAGGSSSGTEGGCVGQRLGSKKAMLCCRFTDVKPMGLFAVSNWRSVESTIILK